MTPIRRAESFDRIAADYDRYRHLLPDEIVQCILAVAKIQSGTRILEIGCGTGQLSVPLARHGVELIAVELGANLATLARQNLAGYPNARVDVGAFEEWELPEKRFDVVVSKDAFHWIDPQVRFVKTADSLNVGGYLVIVSVHPVAGGTPGFFEDLKAHYIRYGISADEPLFEPNCVGGEPLAYPELESQPRFDHVQRQCFQIPRPLTAESYVGWLKTYSLVNNLAVGTRQRFLDEIRELICTKYENSVIRNIQYEITSAQRVSK